MMETSFKKILAAFEEVQGYNPDDYTQGRSPAFKYLFDNVLAQLLKEPDYPVLDVTLLDLDSFSRGDIDDLADFYTERTEGVHYRIYSLQKEIWNLQPAGQYQDYI